jgi:hypothetical protein
MHFKHLCQGIDEIQEKSRPVLRPDSKPGSPEYEAGVQSLEQYLAYSNQRYLLEDALGDGRLTAGHQRYLTQ